MRECVCVRACVHVCVCVCVCACVHVCVVGWRGPYDKTEYTILLMRLVQFLIPLNQ